MNDAPSRAGLNSERAQPGLIPCIGWLRRIPEGLAALRRDGRPDHRGGHHSEGDGLRHDRRATGPGGPLHGVPAHADLCGARNLSAAQREHHHNDRHPDRRRAWPGRPGGGSGVPAGRVGHADAAGGSRPRAGVAPAAGLRRQFHFRAGPDRLQGGNRARHRPGPGPEAPGYPFPQGIVPATICSPRAEPPRHLGGNPGGRRPHGGHPGWNRAAFPAGAGGADRGGARDRRHGRVRTAGPRSGVRRPDPPGPPILHLARPLPCRSSSGPAPWALR